MYEDKQAICNALAATLRITRDHTDLRALHYERSEDGTEFVRAVWGDNKAVKTVNVTADSGQAMIRDIMKWI